MGTIFDRQRVTPSGMRAVAQRRFEDALCLVASDLNARANGAMYLAGFTIEILLKAQMLRDYPDLNTLARPADQSDIARWELIFRRHDLEQLLRELPGVVAAVSKAGEKAGVPYRQWLQSVCETWTIFARYSTMSSTIAEANLMLDRIRVLKELL